jgi:hypothetical protein
MPGVISTPSILASATSSRLATRQFAFLRDPGRIGYMKIRMILGCVLTLLGPMAQAGFEVYQSADAYVTEMFAGGPPAAQALWIKPDLRHQLTDVLGHKPSLRVRYWRGDKRTVWILDEVGKDQPITAGVVINDGAIEDIRVLAFRESRGWEIKYPFFTRQFLDARLDRRGLTQDIDGITGATLSVRAMKRMARAALLLHEHTVNSNNTLAQAR